MNSTPVSKDLAVVCCFAAILAAAAALAAQSNASEADKRFVAEALKGDMAEVQLGQLAEQKGNSDDVRKFGQKMVEDHTRLGDQMKGVAGQVGVTVPSAVSPEDRLLKKKLDGLSGNQFDEAYIKAMVEDHEEDVKAFRKEAGTATSSVVKSAASQGADVMANHLSMITRIAHAHNIPVRAD
ncbi:MAG: DUF4142 domain-containing protein [Terracidiphilus sp.]